MSFEPFTDVILTADMPEHGLKAGDVGSVVERHVTPSGEEGYSVEFAGNAGRTVAVVTVPASMLRAPMADDVPAARLRDSA